MNAGVLCVVQNVCLWVLHVATHLTIIRKCCGLLCRDDMRQEVMQKLEQFRALNKELSEHKNTGKGLQEQLDQLRSIREVGCASAGCCVVHSNIRQNCMQPRGMFFKHIHPAW